MSNLSCMLEKYHYHSYNKEGDHSLIDFNKRGVDVFAYAVCV